MTNKVDLIQKALFMINRDLIQIDRKIVINLDLKQIVMKYATISTE